MCVSACFVVWSLEHVLVECLLMFPMRTVVYSGTRIKDTSVGLDTAS